MVGEYRFRGVRVLARVSLFERMKTLMMVLLTMCKLFPQEMDVDGCIVAMQSKTHVLHSNFASLCFREWCFYT